MTIAIGTRLGPYEVAGRVGAGGMGEVYRALDPRLGREVAIKVLPPTFASDRERLQRFEQEARAAGSLNHPNILSVYDVGTSDGAPYLVTELLEGENLRDRLASGPMPPRQAILAIQQAAAGLAVAHAKGIIHRDLKPENLFILPDGRIKILDFGLAKLTRKEGPIREETGPLLPSLTVSGTILGTASYMAPEQVRDQPTDHRADFFSLGAILFELLTGAKAFPGETPADRISAILNRESPSLPAEIMHAWPGLEDVIRYCLEKRAESRFDSARDLAFALGLLL
jgi:eukaryotic-like serine/threonine-protein kinase